MNHALANLVKDHTGTFHICRPVGSGRSFLTTKHKGLIFNALALKNKTIKWRLDSKNNVLIIDIK